MDETNKKIFKDVLTAIVPSMTDEQFAAILNFIVNFEKKREDEISLQNFAIIAVNAIKHKTWKPAKLLGANTLDDLKRAGVDDATLDIIAAEMGDE